jgi:hypothetical protein
MRFPETFVKKSELPICLKNAKIAVHGLTTPRDPTHPEVGTDLGLRQRSPSILFKRAKIAVLDNWTGQLAD